MLLSPQLLFLLGLMALVGERVTAWDNDWDRGLNRDCPRGQAVYRISSYHDNGKEDRRFTVQCRGAGVTFDDCYWSGWVNNFDREVNFQCRDNFVVTGMQSYHSNSHEDRRFQFHCCKSPKLETHNCKETYWVNWWDRYFFWIVPGGNYMTGMRSVHDNGREDRRFRFKYCQGRYR